MMCKNATYKTFWLVGLLCVISVIVILKGCEDDHKDRNPAVPQGTEARKMTLNIAKALDTAAKATGISIEAVGVNEFGEAIGPRIGPVVKCRRDRRVMSNFQLLIRKLLKILLCYW